MTDKVHATTPAEARTLWVLGDQVRFMGQVDGTDLHVLDVVVPPGSGTPPHTHRSPEIFRVSEGEVTFGIFGDGPPRMIVAGPGTVVTVPSNVGHNYQNRGSSPAVMTSILETQMVDFFSEIGSREQPPAGPPAPEAIEAVMAACARHGIRVLEAA